MRNQVRIIGGKWRSRKISFPSLEGLRPTPDRVRETIFNWLAPHIIEARCLDLFAGSGALGFEALSRGAAQVVCIEKDPKAISAIKQSKDTLLADGLEIIQTDSLKLIETPYASPAFEIAFVDPPYRLKVLPQCFLHLQQNGFLKTGAFIQFESEEPILNKDLPSSWEIIHQKKAGVVHYYLAMTN